jgi:hypothetical protein
VHHLGPFRVIRHVRSPVFSRVPRANKNAHRSKSGASDRPRPL